MPKLRLEIDEIALPNRRKRWKLYFLLYVVDPKDPAKKWLGIFPSDFIRIDKDDANHVKFDSETMGSSGLHLITADIPENNEIKAELYIMHTRKATRTISSKIDEIKESLDPSLGPVLNTVLSSTALIWLPVANIAFDRILGILKNLKDRQMGFVSLSILVSNQMILANDTFEETKNIVGGGECRFSWTSII